MALVLRVQFQPQWSNLVANGHPLPSPLAAQGTNLPKPPVRDLWVPRKLTTSLGTTSTTPRHLQSYLSCHKQPCQGAGSKMLHLFESRSLWCLKGASPTCTWKKISQITQYHSSLFPQPFWKQEKQHQGAKEYVYVTYTCIYIHMYIYYTYTNKYLWQIIIFMTWIDIWDWWLLVSKCHLLWKSYKILFPPRQKPGSS